MILTRRSLRLIIAALTHKQWGNRYSTTCQPMSGPCRSLDLLNTTESVRETLRCTFLWFIRCKGVYCFQPSIRGSVYSRVVVIALSYPWAMALSWNKHETFLSVQQRQCTTVDLRAEFIAFGHLCTAVFIHRQHLMNGTSMGNDQAVVTPSLSKRNPFHIQAIGIHAHYVDERRGSRRIQGVEWVWLWRYLCDTLSQRSLCCWDEHEDARTLVT